MLQKKSFSQKMALLNPELILLPVRKSTSGARSNCAQYAKETSSNYLRYVNIGTLGSGNHHHFEIVKLGELLLLPVRKSTSGALSNCNNTRNIQKKTRQITWDTLISEPLDPATTITLKLLNSVKDLLAEAPVLSRASFKIRLT